VNGKLRAPTNVVKMILQEPAVFFMNGVLHKQGLQLLFKTSDMTIGGLLPYFHTIFNHKNP
jgi:hypothetical protein